MGKTLSDKVWEQHVVRTAAGEPDLLYIDLHLVHEVTSPQAFDGLRMAGRSVRRTDLTMATEDHNTPTLNITAPIADPFRSCRSDTLRANAAEFGVRIHSLGDLDQGVVHIIGPLLGLTQPGLTVVCGELAHRDPRTPSARWPSVSGRQRSSTCSPPRRCPRPVPRRWPSTSTAPCLTASPPKDIVLALIAKVGTGGGQGYIVEYRGDTISGLSMKAGDHLQYEH